MRAPKTPPVAPCGLPVSAHPVAHGCACWAVPPFSPDRAPVAKSWKFRVAGSPKTKRGAGPGMHGNMHSSRKTDHYEMLVAGAAIDAGLAAGRGPCEVKLELVLPTRHWKDADRVTSAIFDGMKKAGRHALYDDNLCIIQRTIVELVAIDENCPGAEITVTMLPQDRSR